MIQFFISVIAKQTHNKKQFSTWICMIRAILCDEKDTKNTQQQSKQQKTTGNNSRTEQSKGKPLNLKSKAAGAHRSVICYFFAVFFCFSSSICQQVLHASKYISHSVYRARKNRDYLWIIPFCIILFNSLIPYFPLHSFDFGCVCVCWCCAVLYSMCTFLHKWIQAFLCLLFALILMYTYL